MLYQPNFCNHCGEKVERIEWKVWTSRRFCQNCELAFRKVDWWPRIGAGLAILFGLFGFGSYLKTPEKSLTVTSGQFLSGSSNRTQNIKPGQVTANGNSPDRSKNINQANQTTIQVTPTSAPKNEITGVTKSQQNEPTETVYFCGAQTKKGTPCTRKVKGGGRCWQHEGQPAMFPKEKLVASQ